jgi:hypothetical protein
MIKELTIILLRGRTLITPSSIPDGAMENHHMAHDNCYVWLFRTFPMRRLHLFSLFQFTLSGSLGGSVNFFGCPGIRFTNLFFEFHGSSPTKPGCGCKQYRGKSKYRTTTSTGEHHASSVPPKKRKMVYDNELKSKDFRRCFRIINTSASHGNSLRAQVRELHQQTRRLKKRLLKKSEKLKQYEQIASDKKIKINDGRII